MSTAFLRPNTDGSVFGVPKVESDQYSLALDFLGGREASR